MKSKNPYTFFDRYCLRTPILSIDFYRSLTNSDNIPIDVWSQIWNNSVIKEAVFLASPELFGEIDKWLQKEITDTKTISKLQTSLLKYLSRMTSRCTPFGLFAGCSLGSFAKRSEINLHDISQYQRQTRFDMHFLVALAQQLARTDTIKNQLSWYPNTSLYSIGDQYRYIEYTYTKNNRREHSIEAVTISPYLESIILKAENGASIDVLASLLVDNEITKEEATDFIYELIDNQILVSELEPSICGEDFLTQLITILNDLEGITASQKKLNSFTEALLVLDKTIGNPITQYHNFIEQVKKMESPMEQKYLLQTDVYPKTISNQLDIKWGYRIQRLLSLFNKISPASQNTHLQKFATAFYNRYETREVPLTTVLDTEIGVGYLQSQKASDSTPFLEGLVIPAKRATTSSLDWNPFYEVLHKKLEGVKASGAQLMEIEDADFTTFQENWNTMPDTISGIAELVIIDGKEKMFLSSIGGSSAANLLGRFTTGSDELREYVKEITSLEQELKPNHILAEIIHLPESRIGNVIQRAEIREYEIPYLGKSNVSKQQQIGIQDLMVSVQNGKVYLRSKKLNKYILPRLSNAHNYSANSLPIYHFLCDLQKQDTRPFLGFNWGSVLEKEAFLPRVVYKDFILSKARWKIDKTTIQKLVTTDPNNLKDTVQQWRANTKLPEWVQLVDGDNTLLINLENKQMLRMWLETVKKRGSCILEEFLFAQECVVKRAQEGFTNQMVISMHREVK